MGRRKDKQLEKLDVMFLQVFPESLASHTLQALSLTDHFQETSSIQEEDLVV